MSVYSCGSKRKTDTRDLEKMLVYITFFLLPKVFAESLGTAVKSSAYDDGSFAVELICGTEEVGVRLCVDFTAKTGKIWTAGITDDWTSGVAQPLLCRTGHGEFRKNRNLVFVFDVSLESPPRGTNLAKCTGILPLGPGSGIWNYIYSVEASGTVFRFITDFREDELTRKAITDGDSNWFYTNTTLEEGPLFSAQTFMNGVLENITLLNVAKTMLSAERWQSTLTNKKLCLENAEGKKTDVVNTRVDKNGNIVWSALALPSLENSLGTDTLSTCNVYFSYSMFAAKCRHRGVSSTTVMMIACIVSVFSAAHSMYPINDAGKVFSSATILISLAVLLASKFELCFMQGYYKPFLVTVVMYLVCTSVFMCKSVRSASMSFISGIALEAVLSTIPEICQSPMNLFLILIRSISVNQALLYGLLGTIENAKTLAVKHATSSSAKTRKKKIFVRRALPD